MLLVHFFYFLYFRAQLSMKCSRYRSCKGSWDTENKREHHSVEEDYDNYTRILLSRSNFIILVKIMMTVIGCLFRQP